MVVADGPVASVAVIVTCELPAVIGVPAIWPLLDREAGWEVARAVAQAAAIGVAGSDVEVHGGADGTGLIAGIGHGYGCATDAARGSAVIDRDFGVDRSPRSAERRHPGALRNDHLAARPSGRHQPRDWRLCGPPIVTLRMPLRTGRACRDRSHHSQLREAQHRGHALLRTPAQH